jgi:nitrite reductase/ring-hydroxylating ferredoxin subunit
VTRRYVVGRASEIPPGSVRIVMVQNPQGIGVFNVSGRFFALKNVCPHQGGPLCLGPITGTTRAVHHKGGPPESEWIRDGEIVRCPWHRWEFDIATGKTVFESRMRVAKYRVTVDQPERLSDEERAALAIPPDVETFRVTEEDGLVILEA